LQDLFATRGHELGKLANSLLAAQLAEISMTVLVGARTTQKRSPNRPNLFSAVSVWRAGGVRATWERFPSGDGLQMTNPVGDNAGFLAKYKLVALCHYPRESLRRAQINKLENHAAEALSLTEVM
jgi:hypothetical protein